jgi:hypothetical protein
MEMSQTVKKAVNIDKFKPRNDTHRLLVDLISEVKTLKEDLVVTKDALGIAVPSSSSGYSPSTGHYSNNPNYQGQGAGHPAIQWPSPNQWHTHGKEAAKKAWIEYLNAANQYQSEEGPERKMELAGRMNIAVTSVTQGLQIGTEAAEQVQQRVRQGDQAAVLEKEQIKDIITKLLKLLWVHNTSAKSGKHAGLEVKPMDSQLTGRLTRAAQIPCDDFGLSLQAGEDPDAIFASEYNAQPSPEQMQQAQDQAAQTAGEQTPPTMEEQGAEQAPAEQEQAPPQEVAGQQLTEEQVPPQETPQPSEQAQQEAAQQDIPIEDFPSPDEQQAQEQNTLDNMVGGQAPPEEEQPVEETPEEELPPTDEEDAEAQEEIGEAAESQDEADVERQEAEQAKDEATQQEAEAQNAEEQADEESSEAAEETGEALEGEEPKDEEVEEGEAPSEEEAEGDVEDEEDDEEPIYCIECDREVDEEDIQNCTNPRCPFRESAETGDEPFEEEAPQEEEKTPEEPVEEEKKKHFVFITREDHSECNCKPFTVKQFDGVDGEYCLDHQVPVYYAFDQSIWTAKDAHKWTQKNTKSYNIQKKSATEIVYETIADLPDTVIKQFIQSQKEEAISKETPKDIEVKSVDEIDLDDGQLEDAISSAFTQAFSGIEERFKALGL